MSSTIIGMGHYAPERVVANGELEEVLGLDPGSNSGACRHSRTALGR